MDKRAYIMVGLSGSGKSTDAKSLASEFKNAVICSTDDFFMVDGVYKWDPAKLSENHGKNQAKFVAAMKARVEIVVCDNTNLKAEYRAPYIQQALLHGYTPVVYVVGNPLDPNHVAECASRNVHGLTLNMIQRQARLFDMAGPQVPFMDQARNEVG